MNVFPITRRKSRLGQAIAASVMLGAASVASADPVSLTLEYTCPFPLIGNQPIRATINAELPTSIQAGEPTPAFGIEAVTLVNEDSRLGLKLVGSETIEGKAFSTTNVILPGRVLPLNVELDLPPSHIPNESGAFEVVATGVQPPLLFDNDDVGMGRIEVNELVLDLVARTASGQIAPPPIGEFVANCTLNPGQNNVLQTFEVVGDEPVLEPRVQVAPDAVDFGSVVAGLTAERTVTVSNTGNAALGVNGVFLEGGDAASFMETNNCTTVAPGSSCSVALTYFPSGEGVQATTLVIESSDPNNATVEVPVSGRAVAAPVAEISVSPDSVNFGAVDQGQTASRSVTVSNLGSAALNIIGIDLAGDTNSEFFQSHNCALVMPAASCTVELGYTPVAEGNSSASLVIESDDPDQPSLSVALSGQGLPTGGGNDFVLDVLLNLEGSTFIKAAGSSLALDGYIDASLKLASGEFTADMVLNPTRGSFQLIQGFRRIVGIADVEFEQVSTTVGLLDNNTLTAQAEVMVSVPKAQVSLFGLRLPIGGGKNCRTSESVVIDLVSPAGEFDALLGGPVSGTYSIPPLRNCGLLTDVLNMFMTGSGNTIDLVLTPDF